MKGWIVHIFDHIRVVSCEMTEKLEVKKREWIQYMMDFDREDTTIFTAIVKRKIIMKDAWRVYEEEWCK